ncbi:MAG: hypothetical protein AMXMBFR44_2590 [Candidatus Campbellbacteria bacterium]
MTSIPGFFIGLAILIASLAVGLKNGNEVVFGLCLVAAFVGLGVAIASSTPEAEVLSRDSI